MFNYNNEFKLMIDKGTMGEILVDVRICNEGGLVGITEKDEEIKLSLPCPQTGFLGFLPDKIKVGSVQYGKWVNRMIKEQILDSPPFPDYIHLGINEAILEDRRVIVPYDDYIRID
jgi:hypothetical protein